MGVRGGEARYYCVVNPTPTEAPFAVAVIRRGVDGRDAQNKTDRSESHVALLCI